MAESHFILAHRRSFVTGAALVCAYTVEIDFFDVLSSRAAEKITMSV